MLVETSSPTVPAAPASRAVAVWPALTAVALGIALLYVVGFAAPHAVHEAAHDTRHSMNFPCH
jgi:cobalt transporter subunit CbtB